LIIAKLFFTLLYLFVTFLSVSGQRKGHFSAGFTPGIMYYQGDLSGSIFPKTKTTHFSIGIDFGYQLNTLLTFSLGYTFGKISGADSLVSGKEERNFHFYSYMNDIRFLTYIDLSSIYRRMWPKMTLERADWEPGFTGPDLILGVGVLNFNPKGEINGSEYSLRYLGTEGQYIDSDDYDSPYSLWQINIKYGLGIGFDFTRQINVEFQIIYNQVFTDYLDDVSGNYPEYKDLMKSPRGQTANYFTYGGKNGNNISQESYRGNPGRNDGFMTIGFKIIYTFGRTEFDRIMKL